ncbi:sortase [Ochromonadaceae sp. CCMP2298]|nr:sortase [Ochromonadaceae sp. CCMP2298]
MSGAATVRDATVEDMPAILEIFNEQVLNSAGLYMYEEHTLEMRVQWFEDRLRNDFPVIVAVINGVVAGFGSYGSYRAYPGYKYTVEHSVYIEKTFRGQGVGKVVMDWLIEDAQRRDKHVMVACIDAANEASIKFHEKLGFVHAGTLKQAGFKFGRWLDATFLQLILKTPENPIAN